MSNLARNAITLARVIQQEIPKRGKPSQDEAYPESEQVLSSSLFQGTRGYIEQVVNQINGCYEDGWFDACAVMIRRLVENLIIEAFEYHGLSKKIKNASGDFYQLGNLIDKAMAEGTWNLSRGAKRSLQKLKNIGDWSAHSRRYNAHRYDIDKIMDDLRIVSQELVYLAGLK